MEIPKHEIITVEFYDGTTEGFIKSFKDFGTCYFKMIADVLDGMSEDFRRLYVINKIDETFYKELVEIMVRNGDSTNSKDWWIGPQVGNEKDKQKIERILDSGLKSLYFADYLVLGEGIDDHASRVFRISDQIKAEVHKVLGVGNYCWEDLKIWIPRLEQLSEIV